MVQVSVEDENAERSLRSEVAAVAGGGGGSGGGSGDGSGR